MLRRIDQCRAARGEVFLEVDRHYRRLPAGQIVTPDVTRLFEYNRVLPDRRELDVVILEGRELLGVFAGQIRREEIHPAVAIGDEIDAVIRPPHRADVLRRIVGQVLDLAGLEIKKPNVIGHAAAIMFPGAEFTEDAVVNHLGVVRRKGREPAARHGQLLRQVALETRSVKLADEGVESTHARAEHDERPGVFPRHHDVVRAHSVRDIVATHCRRRRNPFRHAAVPRHHVNFGVAVVLRRERELFSVRGKTREGSVSRPARETARDAAFLGDGVELARVTEDDLLAVGSGKTQEPGCVRQRLG